MRKWTIITAAVLTVILLAQNMQTVTVRFLVWSASMPQIALLTLALLLGLLVGLLLPSLGGSSPKHGKTEAKHVGGSSYA